ncbi:MAG: histidine kinase [Treponema sp.]|nr:histidine kinase [Treponema sp.]
MLLNKQKLLKFIIPFVYVAAVVLMIVFSWNHEKAVLKETSPLFIDLTESPVYIRQGFSLICLRPENFDQLAEDLRAEGSGWVRFFSPPPFLVMGSPLANLPQRSFMSSRGSETQEFTILIPIEVNEKAISYMEEHPNTIPGIYLAGIGDNWQVYLNGTLVISEMHLSQDGQILEQRAWRNVSFPVNRSLIIPGINVLAFRIIGDPTYGNTGLFYASPYYMDDYQTLIKQSNNFILLILCGIFLISGVYYFVLFLSLRTKREIYFILFSIFSLLLCIFTITRHSIINIYIPNSAVSGRIEFYSYMLAVVIFGMFVETFSRGKITKITWGYLLFVFYFILTIQFFPSKQYRNDFALIANFTNIIYYFYIFFYSIVYFYFFDKKGPKNKNFDVSVVSIISAAFLIFLCDVYEILSYFIHFFSFNFFIYSAITAQIGMVLTLAQRYIKQKREVQQNLIAIMLSQMQPHLLYNSLTVIKQLCKTDPETAGETVDEFASYLRGNLDSLTQAELIPFERELHHVQTYLALEKKRFGKMLNIIYEINFEKFMLPTLILQPIVENAVNYGIIQNENGGTIKIKTEKVKKSVVITVTDNGGGFKTMTKSHNDRTHTGIENVRSRLKAMCGGTLEIQSYPLDSSNPINNSYPKDNNEPGAGTTVTMIIPIKKDVF